MLLHYMRRRLCLFRILLNKFKRKAQLVTDRTIFYWFGFGFALPFDIMCLSTLLRLATWYTFHFA